MIGRCMWLQGAQDGLRLVEEVTAGKPTLPV
jgi:hypothetical protein